jgi:hypothetical protein
MSDQYDDDLIVDDSDDVEEIEIGDEGVETEEATGEEPGKKDAVVEKKQTRHDKRINTLTWEKKTAQENEARAIEQAEAFKRQSEELLQRVIDAEKKLGEANQSQSSEKARLLKIEKAEALEIGDYNRVAEVDDELMEIKIQSRQQPTKEPERIAAPEPSRPKQENRTDAQIAWEKNNQSIVNDAEKSAKVNRILERLVNEAGIPPDDPRLWALVDKNLNRTKPPSQAGNGMGGSNGASQGLTRDDFEHIKALGYDPKNKATQERYLNAKIRALEHGKQ